MAKITLTDIVSLANAASAKQAINDNFQALREAIEKALFRDGTSPNAMQAEIDMGEHKILNVADPVADLDAVNKRTVGTLVDFYAGQIAESIIEGTARTEVFEATSGQTEFVLQETPGTANNTWVTDSGILMTPGVDYVLTGTDLKTINFFVGRGLGNEVVVRYMELSPADSVLRADLGSTLTGRGADLVNVLNGTYSRSVRDVLQDFVSVMDYIPPLMRAAIRAKTSTDDVTTYIQNAVNAVGIKGGTLWFPAGLYNISATIDVPFNNVHIVGQGSGHYTADGITSVRDTATTRIAWIGVVPASGTPMIEFRTPATARSYGRGSVRDLMLDGNVIAKVGLAFTSYNHGRAENVHVYACMEDGFLFRTANYAVASGAAACQFNTLYNPAITAYGGSGAYLTNPCNGVRFIGSRYRHINPAQNGDSSHNTVISPRFDLAKGTAIVFEGVGQNTVYSPQGGAWAGSTSGYDIIFGSTDQDSTYPPAAGVTNPLAAVARYNSVFWAEHAVVAKASVNTNGAGSFGNMVWGASRGNGAPEPWIEAPVNNTSRPELLFQTLGSSPIGADTSRTVLGGVVEVVGRNDTAAVSPAFFLVKNSDVGTAGDGLAKIQWRMTNDAGTINVDAGRIDGSITNATAGSETSSINVFPMYGGNETQRAIGFQNGVTVPDANAPSLAYQGFGTMNISVGYYVDNVKVLGPRDTGWTAMTGTANKATAYNTATVTLVQLAERVKALQDALTTHGITGV